MDAPCAESLVGQRVTLRTEYACDYSDRNGQTAAVLAFAPDPGNDDGNEVDGRFTIRFSDGYTVSDIWIEELAPITRTTQS